MVNLQEMLSKIVSNAQDVFAAEAGSIATLNPSKKQIVIQAAVGSEAKDVVGSVLSVGEGIIGWVLSHGEATAVADAHHDRRFSASIDERIGFHTKSIMCVPLWVDSHIVGVIELVNINPKHLNDDGLKILNIFAEYAALAIENSNLLNEVQNWSEQQLLLFDPESQTAPNRSLESILNVVGHQIIEVFGADVCLISRWGKRQNQLHILQSYTKPKQSALEHTVRLLKTSPMISVVENNVVGLTQAEPVEADFDKLNLRNSTVSRKPYATQRFERNAPNIPTVAADWLQTLNLQSLFLIPLVHYQQTIGLVEVGCCQGTPPLTQDDLHLIQTMLTQAATAIQHAILYDETSKRLAEATVLRKVMMVAASTLNFDAVLEDTIQALHEALGIERLAVFLPLPSQQMAKKHPASIGFSNQLQDELVSLKQSPLGWVYDHQETLVLPNAHLQEYTHELQRGVLAAIYLPLILDDEVEAILAAESPHLNAFDRDVLNFFQAIAAELVIALKNVKLFQAERQLADQRHAIIDIFADLTSALEPELLFQRIIERAVQVIPHADAGSLVVPKGENYAYAAAVGFNIEQLKSFTLSSQGVNENLPPNQKVWRLSQLELANMTKQNVQDHQAFMQIGVDKIQSTIQAGLYSGKNILGILSIDSISTPTAFTKDDEQTLLLFANQAAIALQNSRLFDEVRTAEANYRDLFDNANDFILTLDSRFYVLNANKVALKTTGYKLEEVLGVHVTNFISPRHIPHLYNNFKSQLRSGDPAIMLELDVLGKNKQEILIEATLRIQREQPVRIHCIARDITQRRTLEQELQQTEKLSAIGKLVAGVAHELNNPLTAIIGYTSLLQECNLQEEYEGDLEAISRHAQRARFIVRDLLTFAQKVNLHTKPVNLNAVIESSLMQMQPMLQNHTVEVDLRLDELLPIVMVDSHQLEQVFINLITNACQILGTINHNRQLMITSGLVHGQVQLIFADNGPGIPDHVLSQIFEPFFSTKQFGHGTGLGLSICFGIINEHQGRIWAENQPSGGAAFYIELPIKPIRKPRLQSQITQPKPPIKKDGVRLQILVVDDETIVLNLLDRVLTPLGHTVDTVSDGQTALKKLKQTSYDMIICDILMPKMSGIELYQHVLEGFPDLKEKFIFITGHASDVGTKNFLEKSGLKWLAKPFLPAELERLVADHTAVLSR